MVNYAQRERQQLTDLLEEVGPRAPTCCAGWDTADLVAHLLVRERRPDAGLGLVIPQLAGRSERVRRAVRDGARWRDQLGRLRHGPPWPVRFEPLDRLVNTVEFFVHHEDVRRAAAGFEPRHLEEDEEAALWQPLRLMGRGLARRSPVGLRAQWPDHGYVVVKALTPIVTVVGPPSEVLLYLFGRGQVAQVTLEGDDATIRRLDGTSLGF